MAHLDITKLTCVKTRDGVGKDEIMVYLSIDGGSEQGQGPFLLDKSNNDDEVTLKIHEPFKKRAVVRLVERNGEEGGSNDLSLGVDGFGTTVQEQRDVTFSGNNGRVVYVARIGVST